jgi:alpha-galactosidase
VRLTHVAVDRDTSSAREAAWQWSGSVPVEDGRVRLAGLELELTQTAQGTGTRVDVALHNPTTAAVELHAVRFKIDVAPRVVLENGYQSWSPVAARAVSSIRPWRRFASEWARGTLHAAPWLAGRAVTGDHYLVTGPGESASAPAEGVVGFLHAARHLSTVVATPQGLWAGAWLDGVVLEPGAMRPLDPLWMSAGDPGARYSEYADLWAVEASARRDGASPLGWCSWYQYYWRVTPEHIRQNLELARQHGVALVQIDDGYQRAIGDWLSRRDTWSDADADADAGRGLGEIERLAQEIDAAGIEPGIWTAPFVATLDSEVAQSHPDWFVRDGRDRPLRAMWNPRSWGGWAYALDTTRPDVLGHLTSMFERLTSLGYRYHKIDFCYAAAMVGHRAGDGTTTRAEAVRAGIDAVRAGIGGDAYLLGCGCPLGPAAGLVDAVRVSPDTAPHWGPEAQPASYPETEPAARNAVSASVLRAPLHRRLWVNDPDCLLLRPVRTELSAEQRALLARVVAGAGGFTLLSDDLALYGDAEWATVAELVRQHDLSDRPLDLVDPFADVVQVRSDAATLDVRWSGPNPTAEWILRSAD